MQRAYAKRLASIAEIRDPIVRIRAVYSLVLKYQGAYDSWGGFPNSVTGLVFFSITPQNTINNAAWRGSGGVCRQFAQLLHWSLQQVARISDSKSQNLGAFDFNSELMAGWMPEWVEVDANGKQTTRSTLFAHAWVRVHLPRFSPKGALVGFENFDLDSTQYNEGFAPLIPRLVGLPAEELARLRKDCAQMMKCLQQSK